jgi:hypothetical protein
MRYWQLSAKGPGHFTDRHAVLTLEVARTDHILIGAYRITCEIEFLALLAYAGGMPEC